MPDHTTAERIQAQLEEERIHSQLKPERIQALLTDVPGWSLGEDAGSLKRTYEFPTVRAAGLFMELVAELGNSMGYVPAVDLRSLAVTVTIATRQEDGPLELDFDVARILDNRL
ncbi:MAG: 4a-hydroxytetrahydrobiopterin dehydratase [Acidobacteriota bacterium]